MPLFHGIIKSIILQRIVVIGDSWGKREEAKRNMSNKIKGNEYTLSKIFSSDFEYHIPGYQRPYAWTTAETGILFDDLYDFFQKESVDDYFLGSIVLIKEEDKPYAEVIDGQQRLTTLSILFSAIGNAFTAEKYKNICKKYLQEDGNELEEIPAQPRIFLRAWDQDFFYKYIQNMQLKDLMCKDPMTLSTESQRHILANCKVLCEKIADAFAEEEELLKFCKFLLNRCFLVAVSTSNQESAFRVFSVMNSRGLDLLPTDIIKSKTIGRLPIDKQEAYTEKWEKLENSVGREGFNEVFTHTRTIFSKERPRTNLLKEFEEYVMSTTEPRVLIDSYLIPYTNAYEQLTNCTFASTKNADEINYFLYWLNKTNNYDWMPPAIKFMADHIDDSDYILWFIRKLERLASYLLVTSQDVNHRMDRYKWILVEMDSNPHSSLVDPLKSIELTGWEKQKFADALAGEIYPMTAQRRNYIIQRLDSFVSDGAAAYNSKIFTIEHVLPQHPAKDSEWMNLWPNEEEQKYWLNRIANLVPLSRRHNSEAQNFDFSKKKDKYFSSKSGTSSYTLTTQVLSIGSWTPDVVKERQKNIEKVFADKWELSIDENSATEDNTYELAGRGASAVGYFSSSEAFVVVKGSKISTNETEGIPTNISDKRKDLISCGVISDFCFVRDYEFSSVSTAAAVILGRSSNGRKEWTKIDGRTVAQTGH